MTRLSRSLISAVAGVALLGLAACSAGGTPHNGNAIQATPTTQAEASGLKNFDPCAFLTPQDLSGASVSGPGEKVEEIKSEPGCSYEGEKILLTLYKNAEQTVDKYETSGHWDKYEKFNINGRKAARGVEAGASNQGGCSVVVDAGGGVVLFTVTGIMADSVADPCGEAEKAASKAESRLPK
ncbi:DUF3558 family protein [Saccharopolyspora pogona]|uniref:DUF3558 family protein n=1 Tax=Saccharopolyspora pogona TaxID=333966 RepID=UPI001CC22367|nr:DUF3558 family protein [Saccharopolyspora pogona]